MSYLTMFNSVGLDVPRRWQDGFRWVGNEMPQVPQLLQVFKKLVRKNDFPRYLRKQDANSVLFFFVHSPSRNLPKRHLTKRPFSLLQSTYQPPINTLPTPTQLLPQWELIGSSQGIDRHFTGLIPKSLHSNSGIKKDILSNRTQKKGSTSRFGSAAWVVFPS